MLVTHNLSSVPEYCDRTILLKGTVLAHGPTSNVFIQSNLEVIFGGDLSHFVFGGANLHDDDDTRTITVPTDDERPVII